MTKGVLGLIALSLLVAGCLCSTPKARDPHWQRDVCSQCRMAVSEIPYATQLVGPGMAWRHYDDLGCALKDLLDKSELAGGELFVHVRAEDGAWRWVPAADVRYAEGLTTPMNYGFAPSPTGKLSLDDVRARLAASQGSRP